MINRAQNSQQAATWKTHLEDLIETHQNGWWVTLRLDDNQRYVEGQNKEYDEIACEIGRHSGMHSIDGSIIWQTFFDTMSERLFHTSQVPSGTQSNFHLIKALRKASKVPKHELYFSDQFDYEAWNPTAYRTITGHSGDVRVLPSSRNTILVTEHWVKTIFHQTTIGNAFQITVSGLKAGGKDSKGQRQDIYGSLQDPHLYEGKPRVLRVKDAIEWKAGFLSQQPILRGAHFISDVTIALDNISMARDKIEWHQFESYEVSTATQHIPLCHVKWMRNNKSGAMIYVSGKYEPPKEPSTGGEVSDSEADKPIGKSGSAASTAASTTLALNPSAGGDSAQVMPVTTSIVQSKRIGSGGMVLIECKECHVKNNINLLQCACGADLGGGAKIHEELFNKQKEKSIKSVMREYSFVWKQVNIFIPGDRNFGSPSGVRGGRSWEADSRKKALKHFKKAWKMHFHSVLERFEKDWQFYESMITQGYDQEYIKKIDDLARVQAQTGKGMAIGDRLYKYEQRWVSKSTQSGGADTNFKGKRKGIFDAEKGKRAKGDSSSSREWQGTSTNKSNKGAGSMKGGGKARQ
eukprot:11383983-Karenia_brevis.AAC.1